MLYNDGVNTNNSMIKTAIDYWYQNNMTDFTDYLEDTVWCNDRSISNLGGWNPNGGNTTEYIYFKSANDMVNLTCKNKNDRFTVGKANGNGDLTYPVGLIDITEINLAYDSSYNPSSPYSSNSLYWSFSPNLFSVNYAHGFHVTADGGLNYYRIISEYGVRPSVSLKAGTEYLSGDGSIQHPYVIETPNPNLYERVKLDSYNPTKYVKKYTGDTSTFIGDKDVYYYYGQASNNNVLFANYCWKIIRTTDTGGVKLLYNGIPTNGVCNNMGEASALNASQTGTGSAVVAINNNDNSLADFGYMYNKRYEYQTRTMSTTEIIRYGHSFTWNGTNYVLKDTKDIVNFANNYATLSNYHYTCFNAQGTCSELNYIYFSKENQAYYIKLNSGESVQDALDEMLYGDKVNKIDSNIKKAVDYFYENFLLSYTSYLEDTIYCNNRSSDSIGGWNPNGGNIDNSVNNVMRFRSFTTSRNLACQNKNDRFTTSTDTGNGKLKYPIGLVEAAELQLAYFNDVNSLNCGSIFWTMTPNSFWPSNIALPYFLNGKGLTTYSSYSSTKQKFYVRPSISLKSNTIFVAGDGSCETPYLISTN